MKGLERLILISTVSMVCYNYALCQVEPWSGFETSALLFSQTQYGGSARVQGLGNAFTSLGGDISSISMNPAGLGFYNRSEVSISPALNFINMESDYLGETTFDGKTNFNIGNLGLVFNNTRSDNAPNGWQGGSWGISFNRTNDFHDKTVYQGYNRTNDFIDWILDEANFVQETYFTDLSYSAFLINDFTVNYDYNPAGDTVYVGEYLIYDTPSGPDTLKGVWDSFVSFTTPDNPTLQIEEINTEGAQNQWSFSYGGNFADRFYFGASLGISTIRYESERIYKEVRGYMDILDYFILSEKLRLNGVGINGTFGVILRPVDIFTIGVSYVTPTVYSIEDEISSSVNSLWRESAFDYYGNENGFKGDQLATDDPLFLAYSIKTPQRVNAGGSVFVGKHGFISADFEWVDYGKIRYSSREENFNIENDNIQAMFKSVANIRMGAEYRNGIWRLRGGYQWLGDPYNYIDQVNRSKQIISGGTGIRKKNFYGDLLVSHTFYNSVQSPYVIDPEAVEFIGPTPVADISNKATMVALSFGFFF